MSARRTPYTVIGIRRVRCARCHIRRAHASWQICADGSQYRPICRECDVELNALVLKFMRDPAAEVKMAQYVARMSQ